MQRIIVKTNLLSLLDRAFIKKPFSIASNNCWGYKLYNNLNIQYNTPFIGLYITPSDFNKVCRDLPGFLKNRINDKSFIESNESFPVANVEGVIIYFMHYSSKEEAIDKWNRRSERMLSFIETHGIDKVIFKICQRDGAACDVDNFRSLKLKKTIYFYHDGNFLISRNGSLPSGSELFEIRFMYYLRYIKLFIN